MSTVPGRPTSLADVLKRAISNALTDVHTAIPGKVVKVYNDGDNIKWVDVKPVIRASYLDEDDTRISDSFPVIPGVPIAWPGGGGAYLTFGVAEGDTGILQFSEASLDRWLSKGGEVDPEFDHRFELTDAIFIPGLRPFAGRLKNVPSGHMALGMNEGLRIHIDDSSIRLGSEVSGELDDGALATPIKQWMTDLYMWAVALTLPVSGTTAGPPASPPPTPPTIASGSVKLKK